MFSVLHAQDPKSQASASAAEPRPCTHAWYALRVQSKFESVVSIALRGKGYQEFLPLYRSRRRWADRVKELDLPLFPGLFILSLRRPRPLVTHLDHSWRNVHRGCGQDAISIPDDEIAAVQAIVISGIPAQPWPLLSVGSRIFIERGPLAGLEGTALSTEKNYRLVVSVSLLQRSFGRDRSQLDWSHLASQGSECCRRGGHLSCVRGKGTRAPTAGCGPPVFYVLEHETINDFSDPKRRTRMISLRFSETEYGALRSLYPAYGARNFSDFTPWLCGPSSANQLLQIAPSPTRSESSMTA